MGKRKQKRKEIDWEAVEREFRAGQLSIREIARRNECSDKAIRNKAKDKGWSRDLISKIQKEVRNKLVRNDVRISSADKKATEREIIEAGSNRAVEVELLQRNDISKLRDLEKSILAELGDKPTKLYITQFKGEIVKEEIGIAVTERAAALSNLANVQHKRIQLERQAYRLDEGERDEPTVGDQGVHPLLAEMIQSVTDQIKGNE